MKRRGTLFGAALILAVALMSGCAQKEAEEKETLSVVLYANDSIVAKAAICI